MQEQLRSIAEDLKQVRALLGHLAVFSSLHFDLALLRGEHRFISLFVGTLPAAHLERLRQFAQVPYLLAVSDQLHIAEDDLDALPAGIHRFRNMPLPDEVARLASEMLS